MRDLSAAIRNQPPAEHANDWDPMHMPGSVQAYGALLVAHAQTRQVTYASENLRTLLGIDVAQLIDRSYLTLFTDESEWAFVEARVSPNTILFPNPLRLTHAGRAFDAVFHAQDGYHLIELEPIDIGGQSYADMADNAAVELFNPGTVEELYQRAVRVIRQVTGFDRVMLYRFDARYNGQVLAESVRDGMGSFLGLYFPSTDIGARARDLYLKNFTRYIPDVAAQVVPMTGRPGASQVDMTFTNLRSVFPCHTTYLKNMGVLASMSFSINIDNKLWGLFACHHYAPRLVSYERRVVCEQAAMMFIYKLNMLSCAAARLARRQDDVGRIGQDMAVGAALTRRISALDSAWADAAEQEVARPLVARALAAIQEETSWLLAPAQSSPRASAEEPGVTKRQQLLLDLVEADSAAIVRHGQVYRIGDAPPEMAVFAISSMFGRELPDLHAPNLPVFATDCMSSMVPVTEAVKDRAAGLLAVSLSDTEPAYLLWFRREQIVHATWAGNQEDEAKSGGASSANPRASFAAWKNDIRNLSRPWLVEDVEVAASLLEVVRNAEGSPSRPLSVQAAVAWPPTLGKLPWPTAVAPGVASAVAAVDPLRATAPAPRQRVIRVGHL
jgi:light-regulated signal transduction histidine kinase (bacteriophytochrome)